MKVIGPEIGYVPLLAGQFCLHLLPASGSALASRQSALRHTVLVLAAIYSDNSGSKWGSPFTDCSIQRRAFVCAGQQLDYTQKSE
ncbi:hypothetical protein ACFONL_13340 [Camelimonas fluminis]|uniref:Uncharacterized protein n=1 Tax=Camelimonas fluminis TaxID=1576911 RepID=A0ABV7UIU0_9HYPH|nr:hypothetical protein [Camelimonas fluminis]